MTSNGKEKDRNQPQEDSIPAASINPVIKGGVGKSNAPKPSTHKPKSTQTEQNHTIVVNVPDLNRTDEQANTIAREANKASWWSFRVNSGLVILTMILALTSFWQYTSTQTAANIVRETLDSAKSYQKQAVIAANISDKIKKIREDSVFNYQKRAVEAQINSIRETQKEFEIQNKPFVQIIDMELDNIKPDEKPAIRFNFKVYGKQPVKLRDNKIQVYYWHDKKMPDFKTGYQTDTISAYLGEGSLFKEKRTPRMFLSKTDSTAIKNGISYFYINGYLRYKNIVTNTENYYHYRYKFGYNLGQFDATGLVDTTIEIRRDRPRYKKR